MKIEKFEDIKAWQKAEKLVILVYKIFRGNKDYGFKDQICRASISIMNNIAEGYERQGNKEFARFLYIAKGSSGEVRSMAHVAMEIGYINKEQFDEIYNLSIEISKMLSSFIKKLN